MRLQAAFAIPILMLIPIGHSEAPTTFCDLLRNPEQYNGKEVTVRATWKYGFEWSLFYCLDCLDKGKAWLQVPADLDDASNRALKRIPKGAGIVNLTVRGVFMSGGHFGHMNGFPYEIVADGVSDVAVLQKGMKGEEQEKEVEKRWACGGEKPR